MKRVIAIISILLSSFGLYAQSDLLPKGLIIEELPDEYLDTLDVKKKLMINDYSMFGISYGVNLSQVMWNPTQSQEMLILPMNIGISYTKYGKMFGYMPFFGFQIGLNYTQEGYQFEYNKDKDYINRIEGAEKAIYEVVEMPLYMHGHYDLWNFKVIANIGCYGGYRLGIHRYAGDTGYVKPELQNSFTDTDRRWDYGLKGGFGIGFVFDPIEIHLTATYKHSFGTLYDPDYVSPYYYRYAYPMNITIAAGVYVHLSKRTGRTKADLKHEAMESVYGKRER